MAGITKTYKASVWNEKMARIKLEIKELQEGKTHILCNQCDGKLLIQQHFDFDDVPHKRQYVCSACGEPEYIIV